MEYNKDKEELLKEIIFLLDIESKKINGIFTHLLNKLGAHFIIFDHLFLEEQNDSILLTDNPNHYGAYTLLLVSEEAGFQKLRNNYIKANYNLDNIIDIILLLVEQKRLSEKNDNRCIINSSFYQKLLIPFEYYSLFVETVLLDSEKLYRQEQEYDFISLSQTVHRLKGIFALLNLFLGQRLCEILEQHISNTNELKIKKSIQNIHLFVSTLVRQSKKHYEQN